MLDLDLQLRKIFFDEINKSVAYFTVLVLITARNDFVYRFNRGDSAMSKNNNFKYNVRLIVANLNSSNTIAKYICFPFAC